MKALLTLLFAITLAACFASTPPDGAAEESNIREATFRYQFDKNASGQQQGASTYYLTVFDKDGKYTDPSAEFMKRFARNTPAVRTYSESKTSADGRIVDKKTGEIGLLFFTGDVKRLSDTEAEISGGYYEASLSASGNTYHLKKIGRRWKVVKDVMNSIS